MKEARKFCVIGTPVGHSRSPQLYRRIFDERGFTQYSYTINEITTEQALDAFFDDMKKGVWDGCNVTMPWKTLTAERMDMLLDNAALTRSVNTVIKRGEIIVGDSTDGGGMCDAIISDTGINLRNRNVVILGCGGAARSIIAELALRGAGKINIMCRPGRNRDLTEELLGRIADRLKNDREPDKNGGQEAPDRICTLYDQEDTAVLAGLIDDADILINCTPLGMVPQEDKLPLPESITFGEDLIVADSVYNPDETLLIKKARACNCRTVKGMRMLEMQAQRAAMLYLKQ